MKEGDEKVSLAVLCLVPIPKFHFGVLHCSSPLQSPGGFANPTAQRGAAGGFPPTGWVLEEWEKSTLGRWLRRCLVRWELWLKASPHSGHS